jgi:hypothetical protein
VSWHGSWSPRGLRKTVRPAGGPLLSLLAGVVAVVGLANVGLANVGLANVGLAAVEERARELSIRRAVGASRLRLCWPPRASLSGAGATRRPRRRR